MFLKAHWLTQYQKLSYGNIQLVHFGHKSNYQNLECFQYCWNWYFYVRPPSRIIAQWAARFTLPDQTPWGPPSILYDGYQVSFPGVKWPGHGVDHSPPCGAEVKERVELYLYWCCGPACPGPGWRASSGQVPLLLNDDGVANKGVAFGLNIVNSWSRHYLPLPHCSEFYIL